MSARVHGAGAPRLPGCLSLRLEGIDAPALLAALQPRLALSTGAACSAHAAQPSHVLRAIGLDEAQASATLRLGFGRGNTPEEVERAAAWIADAAQAQLAARRAAPQRAACA